MVEKWRLPGLCKKILLLTCHGSMFIFLNTGTLPMIIDYLLAYLQNNNRA